MEEEPELFDFNVRYHDIAIFHWFLPRPESQSVTLVSQGEGDIIGSLDR